MKKTLIEKTDASIAAVRGAKTAIQKEKATEAYITNFQKMAKVQDEFNNIHS